MFLILPVVVEPVVLPLVLASRQASNQKQSDPPIV